MVVHILRKKHRLRVFENRMLEKIFGPETDEVKGKWRRLHNEELYDLQYSSPNISRVIKSSRMRWPVHVAGMGKRRGAFRILVGNLREKYDL